MVSISAPTCGWHSTIITNNSFSQYRPCVWLSYNDFRKKKSDFVKDIVTSMLVQLLFLMVSTYGVYQIKPVWIAYNVDRFELILSTDLVNINIHNADKSFKSPSYFSPQYVGVEFSKDNEERNNNMFDEVLQGISIAQRPERDIYLFSK
ncbi:hypothetical protein [Psychrobacter cibarius]|uniref:hypothetical protein n=1 Tax=Psychrobacter cibarius TaxID=282669 RepID=UPI001919CC2B|nr:hypothetical protein [Psychrobacter cibarius]